MYYDTAMDVPERMADIFREARDEMIDIGLSNQETYEEFEAQVKSNIPDVEVS